MSKSMGGILLGISLITATAAWADEVLQTLVESGDWAAAEHRPSEIGKVDACFAAGGSSQQRVLFRADERGLTAEIPSVEFRISDRSWSLPAHVMGWIKISIEGHPGWQKETLPDGNTDNMVIIRLSVEELTDMFAAMDSAAQMTVTAGNGKPMNISLVGSTKATNAFRTCADIGGNIPSGDSNPFSN